jgi:hypothetical protein
VINRPSRESRRPNGLLSNGETRDISAADVGAVNQIVKVSNMISPSKKSMFITD